MNTYDLDQTQDVDVEVILSQVKTLKDLLSIEFSDDESNILLLRKICEQLYTKILELQSEVDNLKGRRL